MMAASGFVGVKGDKLIVLTKVRHLNAQKQLKNLKLHRCIHLR